MGENEKRGGYKYYPPKGWIGFGLNVIGKYDNGNDDWLTYNGNKNEWAVAYHGLSGRGPCKNIYEAAGNIIKGDNGKGLFFAGNGQVHKECDNLNNKITGIKKVGIGVYCSPNPKVMEDYAKKENNWKLGLMLRVNPKKIRYCNHENKEYWVLDGTSNEMRPYRILIKKEENKKN